MKDIKIKIYTLKNILKSEYILKGNFLSLNAKYIKNKILGIKNLRAMGKHMRNIKF